MKVVVYGPDRRVGILSGDQVVDANGACAKFMRERGGEARPEAMADAVVPADLAEFIEGGDRAIDHVQRSLDYLVGQAGDRKGTRGETLIHRASDVKLHGPKPGPASRIACSGAGLPHQSCCCFTACPINISKPETTLQPLRAASLRSCVSRGL